MPSTTGVGHSKYSRLKQSHFRSIISEHLAICRRIFWRHSWAERNYLFFDMNAGPGYTEEYGDGSPLIFLQEAHKHDIPYEAAFFEKEPELRTALDTNIKARTNRNGWSIMGPHEEMEPDFFRAWHDLYEAMERKKWFGMLYHDPNGFPSFDIVKRFAASECFQFMDVMIYLSATTVKRCKEQGKGRLSEHLFGINKKYWLIREPIGPHQWTFLVGTNWKDFPKFVDLRFKPLDSTAGQRIFDRLDLTAGELANTKPKPARRSVEYRSYREYLAHPKFKAIRAQVFDRANGVCEKCGERTPTEPHHLKYPPWGTWDVPENLIAVCHQCHCELHGKEN